MSIETDLLQTELIRLWKALSPQQIKLLGATCPKYKSLQDTATFESAIKSMGIEPLVELAEQLLSLWSKHHDCADLQLILTGRNLISHQSRKRIIDALLIKGNMTGNFDWADFANRFLPLKDWPSTDGRYSNAYQDVSQHLVRNSDWEESWFLEEYCQLGFCGDQTFLNFLEQVLHPRVRASEEARDYAEEINQHLAGTGFLMAIVGEIGGKDHWRARAYDGQTISSVAANSSLLERVEQLKRTVIRSLASESIPSFPSFSDLRKALRSHPSLKSCLPAYMNHSRTIEECLRAIKAAWRDCSENWSLDEFVSRTLNPMLDALEEATVEYDSNYEICEKLGEGGFGIVYRLHHRLLGMDFALKVLAPAFDDGSNPGHETRFYKEAALLLSLNHENIVRFYDVGNWSGKPCIRMEFVQGRPLHKFLADHGALTPAKAAVLAKKLGSAVEHAHGKNVLHRDIKPSNIMVGSNEFVKLLDFGVGAYLEDAMGSRITRTGERLAGGNYTAPELEVNPQLLDVRSDIYSIGAVWYTALTGLPPIGHDLVKPLMSVQNVSAAYADLVVNCLRPIQDRVSSAHELLSGLNRVLAAGK